MRDDTKSWIEYAEENFESAKILRVSHLFNSYLQNIQQCAEKALKAILIENSFKFKKTHSIAELKNILEENNFRLDLDDEDCDFLDTIYLPSKYPVTNVLPDYESNDEICRKGISIANSLLTFVKQNIK